LGAAFFTILVKVRGFLSRSTLRREWDRKPGLLETAQECGIPKITSLRFAARENQEAWGLREWLSDVIKSLLCSG
jgi:hypothetical protein